MFRRILMSIAAGVALCGWSILSSAAAIIVDARQADVFIAAPDEDTRSGCKITYQNDSRYIWLSQGSVSAIYFPMPFAKQLVTSGCDVPNSKTSEYTFSFQVYAGDGDLLATITTKFQVTKDANNPQKLSVQYKTNMVETDEGRGKVTIGCNDPHDPACKMTQEYPLPDEYQYDIADQTAFKYFPFSLMIRIEGGS